MGKEIINIKGTRKGLVILVDSDKDFEELKTNLKEKIAASKGFFKGAKFTFELDNNLVSMDKEKELEAICREHGLIPSEEKISLSSASKAVEVKESTETSSEKTLLLTAGLRSGQKVNFNGNVTVLGDVNPGSEIIATGDIIVMGTLRGIAHAGATGNTKAVIVAYRLEAQQLRISDKIGRSPDGISLTTKEPEIAFIHEDYIEINAYVPSKLRAI